MKKTIGFLAALLFVCCMTIPAAAVYTITPASETIPNYRQVYEAIYEAIDDQLTYLDVSRWKIKDHEIMTIFTDVMHNSPEFFYVNQKLVYRYNQNGLVTSLSFSYHMSRTKREECTAFYEAEISYIVNEVEEKLMTEPEMALYVHDYLISAYSYDTTETIFDTYNFLKERKGVCQAYTLCYTAVMRELGIPCFMVVSKDMNHSWNLVQLDGNWYHVDLVYDDPQPDRPGQVLHNHFLLSDDAIAADHGQGAHWGWTSMVVCEDDTYSDKFWKTSDTRMLYLNDMWYYVDDSERKLCRIYFQGHGMRTMYDFTDKWYVYLANLSIENTDYWKGLYTGMGFYNGYIYFNTPTVIWRINPATGELMELLHLDEEAMNIYGMDICKYQMEYLVGDTPDRATTTYLETIPMRYADEETVVENVFLPFEDISRVSPYYRAVEYLYEKGIMSGMSEKEFSLNTNMTRAQFAALISRIYGYDPAAYKGEVLYTDVKSGSWYAPYVNWVTESGYMTGMGSGIFAPEQPVTREQMLTILASVGRSRKVGSNTLTQLQTIDRSSISSWAIGGVDYCYTNGLIAEKYMYALAPKNMVKRSEIADVLYRFCLLQETDGQ